MLYQLSYCPLRVTQGIGRGAVTAFADLVSDAR